MFNLIEDFFLSQILTFVIVSGMLLVVTAWAFRIREYPGYMLGWLVSLFFILVIRTVTGGTVASPPLEEAVASPEIRLSLFAVAIPSVFGLLGGFGILFLTSTLRGASIRRSATIAILTTILVLILYFLTTSDGYTGRLISIFALAFAIGALTMVILGRASPQLAAPVYEDEVEIPRAQMGPPTQNRYDRLRRRIQRPFD